MEIETCPYCHVAVVLSGDGTCPSCRRLVRIGQLTRGDLPGMPSFVDPDAVRDVPVHVRDSGNPYAPPTFIDPAYERKDEFRPRSGLVWVLFSFEGRIPRRVFWGASLLNAVVYYAIVFAVMGIVGEESPAASLVILVLYPFLIWVSLAVSVKRWHDLDKSGWWVLVGLIPCLGPLWTFVETGCLRGTFGDNDYGPDPT